MTDTKPWYLSRTVWASAISVALSMAGVFGLPTDGIDGAALTDTVLQAVAALCGLVAIFGRLAAKSRIG